MKIKLQDYGLISIEWIDKKRNEIQIKRDKCPIGSHIRIVYEHKLSLLEDIKDHLIPSEKLAEVCLVKGGHIEAYPSEPYNEKQQFLKSEIEIL